MDVEAVASAARVAVRDEPREVVQERVRSADALLETPARVDSTTCSLSVLDLACLRQ